MKPIMGAADGLAFTRMPVFILGFPILFRLISILIITTTLANAMAFEVVNLGGEPAIIGRGEIRDGDAARLKAVLTERARHSMGYFALALNSPGGSVKAAFELTRLIDMHVVNTYVPSDFECVSACAAIVFIAGREHVVVGSGLLGFHGCYNARTKETISLCNDVIAQHAFEHGTAYGSVMTFIANVPYNKIIWFDAEQTDCWAISRYQISSPPPNFEKCVIEAIRQRTK